MPRGNVENLRPVMTKEEARERGRRGGIASGVAARRAKSLREGLKLMLSTKIPKDSKLYAGIRAQLDALGLKFDPTVADMPLLGLLNKAAKGSPEAFSVLRDTIGEKPKDVVETTVNAPPVQLGVFNLEKVQAERKRNKAMMDDLKAGALRNDLDADDGLPEDDEECDVTAQDGLVSPYDTPDGSAEADDRKARQEAYARPVPTERDKPAAEPPKKPKSRLEVQRERAMQRAREEGLAGDVASGQATVKPAFYAPKRHS